MPRFFLHRARTGPPRPSTALLAGLLVAAVAAAVAPAGPAAAATPTAPAARAGTSAVRSLTGNLPVSYDAFGGVGAALADPTASPPGANDWSCRPNSTHPYPVVLVHGTFADMADNFDSLSPLLYDHGYCVFAFDYGADPSSVIQATGDIPTSAGQLSAFVDRVLAATGASKVDLVGHSQGGMMPRYYLRFLGGAAKVDALVGLAPSNHGTTLVGLTSLATAISILGIANNVLSLVCQACVEQEQGSSFLTKLNSGGDTVPGVRYTVIETINDLVVTPYTSAFLSGGSVTNITVQNQCWLDGTDHVGIAFDPIALTDVLNALDPAHHISVPCQLVLPVVPD
jgi:triacylglycerol esterase/lipase EstA (alpha/beta hydrolase family)